MDTNCSRTDLRGHSFEGQNLTGVDFSWSYLDGANFRGSKLKHARFYHASLVGADFEDAYVAYSSFDRANISNASFVNADARGTIFTGVSGFGVDFCGADVRGANFIDADVDSTAFDPDFYRPTDSSVGWKAVRGGLVRLEFPQGTARIHVPTSRKRRAARCDVTDYFALPVWRTDVDKPGTLSLLGGDVPIDYVPGSTFWADHLDRDWRKECTNGIHYFDTVWEATSWMAVYGNWNRRIDRMVWDGTDNEVTDFVGRIAYRFPDEVGVRPTAETFL